MKPVGLGSLSGQNTSKSSWAWDLGILFVLLAVLVILTGSDAPMQPLELLGAFWFTVFLAAISTRLISQINIRRSGCILRVKPSPNGEHRLESPALWLSRRSVVFTGGEPWVLSLATGTQGLSSWGDYPRGYTVVAKRDHIVVSLAGPGKYLRVVAYCQPDQAWIDALIADLQAYGMNVTFSA